MRSPAIHGLYAVTPDEADTEALLAQVSAALTGGARVVQYRNKTAAPALRLEQARAVKALCEMHRASLIINDHLDLAKAIDAAGVHLGAEDGATEAARDALGAGKLIGVSCYNRLELARAAQKSGADYVAFGSFFPSRIKPGAVHAPLELLANARPELHVPIVAIGGITLDKARALVEAGADALAVISAVFGAPDVAAAARGFTALFEARS
ncbi:MAG TPA: thiamine phosphate synthase [Burkholderiales bacterium]|jgi:thiamine-phosphate pyrophosphorylase|nr:thiamine phosphate synthase [Burkholderiales bacterium]